MVRAITVQTQYRIDEYLPAVSEPARSLAPCSPHCSCTRAPRGLWYHSSKVGRQWGTRRQRCSAGSQENKLQEMVLLHTYVYILHL